VAGQQFPDGEALGGEINAMWAGIEKVTRDTVFLEWTERLTRRLETDGKDVD
jgi:hypothetical protein